MNSQLAHCKRRLKKAADDEKRTLDPLDVDATQARVLLEGMSREDFDRLIRHIGLETAAARKLTSRLQVIAHAVAGNVGNAVAGEAVLGLALNIFGDDSSHHFQEALERHARKRNP